MKSPRTQNHDDSGPLTDKQLAFVRFYAMQQPPRNRKQAAIDAGYSPATADQQASRMLSKNVKVKAELEKLLKDVDTDVRITLSQVHKDLAEQYMLVGDPDSDYYNPVVAASLIGHMIKLTGEAPKRTMLSGDPDGAPIKTEAREISEMDIAARLAALEAAGAADSE